MHSRLPGKRLINSTTEALPAGGDEADDGWEPALGNHAIAKEGHREINAAIFFARPPALPQARESSQGDRGLSKDVPA